MKNRTALFLIFLFILAFFSRSYFLDNPPYEQHMWRQCQTMSTIVDYYRNGTDLLRPKVNWMGYPGYLAFEFPLFQAIGASIYRFFGPEIAHIRLFNILFSLLGALFLFLFTKRTFGERSALFAVFFYLFFPINIIYQRATLVDPFVVALMLISIWLLDLMFSSDRFILLKAASLALVLLAGLPIKALFFLPFFILLFLRLFDKGKLPSKILALLSVLPAGAALVLWLFYSTHLNSMYHFSRYYTVVQHLGISSLFKLNYYLQLGWRFINMELTAFGVFLCFISILCIYSWYMNKDQKFYPAAVTVAIPVLYLALFANINHPHTYYQLPIMPFFAILAALGAEFLLSFVPSRWKTYVVVSIIVSFLAASLHVMVVNAYMFPERDPLVFQDKIKGLVEPQKYVIFLGGNVPETRLAGRFDPNRKFKGRACEYLYAMDAFGLFGNYDTYEDGIGDFVNAYPHFHDNLDYVVFYDFPVKRPPLSVFAPVFAKGFKVLHDEAGLLIFRR